MHPPLVDASVECNADSPLDKLGNFSNGPCIFLMLHIFQEYDASFCIIFLPQPLSSHYFSKNQQTKIPPVLFILLDPIHQKVSNGQSTRSLKEEIQDKEKTKSLLWSPVT